MSSRRCPICCTRHNLPNCDGTAAARWPIQPLIDAAHPRSLAKILNVKHAIIERARLEGCTDTQADQWAIALRTHPAYLWPDWCEPALTPIDRAFIHGGGWRRAWLHTETSAA